MTSRQWQPALLLGALLLCALTTGATAADDQLLARFFLTPAERAILEARRWHRPPPPVPVGTPLRTAAEPDANPLPVMEPSETITLSGVVLRSSGKQTIWLNSRPYSENGPLPAGIKAPHWRDRNQIKVVVEGPGGRIDLKPGQTLTRATGQTQENFSRQTPTTNHPDDRNEQAANKK